MWRIWRVDRASARAGLASTSARAGAPSRLAQALRIVVESGALYTALVLATFGTELAGSNAIYGVSDVVRPVPLHPVPLVVVCAQGAALTRGCRWSSSSASRST